MWLQTQSGTMVNLSKVESFTVQRTLVGGEHKSIVIAQFSKSVMEVAEFKHEITAIAFLRTLYDYLPYGKFLPLPENFYTEIYPEEN